MLCERCKIREANIRCTEIINGIKTEHNLCSYCAREMGFGQCAATLDGESPSGKPLSGPLGPEDDEEETDMCDKVVCPTCGTSSDGFVENSRFGCPDCYGVFDLFISDKMKQLQGSGNHKGKHSKFRSTFEREHPAQTDAEETEETIDNAAIQENGMDNRSAAVNKQIRELEIRLKKTVKQEEYELAAQCCDQIKGLKEEADIHE